jgi:hypothetical protein
VTKLETTLICVIAFILITVGFAFYFEHRGAVECKQADAVVVTQTEVKNTQVEASGKAADAQAEKTYADASAAPLAPLPPVGSLQPPDCPSPVPSPRPPPTASDYRPTIRAPTPPSVVQPDWARFERSDVQSGKDADNEVIYLQTLLADHDRVCRGQK